MEPPSSIPRASGIPRPASRLPVLRPSGSKSQLRQPTSTEQLRKKPSLSSLSRPQPAPPSSTPASSTAHRQSSLLKKTSRSSLVHSTTPATSNLVSNRNTLTSAPKRVIPTTSLARSASNAPAFKKPVARPPSRQSGPSAPPAPQNTTQEDVLGDLNGFRSASRASSRAGFHDQDPETALESDSDPPAQEPPSNPAPRKSRPSLSERTIESLSQLPQSPAGGKGRRRSSFFNGDTSMPPPARPASALGSNRRPSTSDGTPRQTPATPKRFGSLASRGSMTAPGKRSVSAAIPSSVSTPSRPTSIARFGSQLKKQPLSQMQNVQTTPRPLSNSKSMIARTPKARPSLGGAFGPPSAAATPSPDRENRSLDKPPETARKVSTSSLALREHITKAKAGRKSEVALASTPPKTASSSGALREQIAKAKEAARRAHAAKQFGNGTPPRVVPAITENEFGIDPDPAEIAEFDFGLEDPFNQRGSAGKSLLKKRVDGARADGRLNMAAMGLSEIPEQVLTMYKYDPSDTSVAWGEVVDMTVIIAADNNLADLPDALFPDVDLAAAQDEEEGPQFASVQTLDFHGNILTHLPVGMRHLPVLSKLNLSRNKLPNEVMDIVSQIPTLRELKLAENVLQGDFPASLGQLTMLEVLELQGNKLLSLPPEMRELAHLRTLNVSENSLKSLPTELFTSVPLVELLASKNAFSGHLLDIDCAPHLQHLQVSNNSLASLCESDSISMPALKHLDMSANRLADLPDISSWNNLTTLLVSENKLTALPEGFVTLMQLRTADFTSNDLTKIDEKVSLMEGLENLTLAANPIRERKFLTMNTADMKRDLHARLEPSLVEDVQEDVEEASKPKSDWQLTPSGTLDLSFKNFTVVDDEAMIDFAQSNDVRQLYLQQNYLTTIPLVLSHLAHLSVLNLSKNSIVAPLDSPLDLPKLRELCLTSNKLKSLDELTANLSAPSLQHLDVSNNALSGSLPILRTTFPSLTLLMASDNTLTEVSSTALEGLRMVSLSNNEISRLDPEIGLLSGSLTSLDVEGNTFRVPNYAVLKKGTETVLAWLRDRIPSPTEEFFVTPIGSPERGGGY